MNILIFALGTKSAAYFDQIRIFLFKKLFFVSFFNLVLKSEMIFGEVISV